jgi:type VI protein secretion system component Hcp
MAEDNRDILMQFPDVVGEGHAALDTVANDPLVAGFKTGFFEVKEFDFGVNQIDDDGAAAQEGPGQGWTDEMLAKHGFTKDARGTILGKDGKPVPGLEAKSARFKKFMDSGSAGRGKSNYPADLEPFGFTRDMDCGSLDLFKGLTALKTYPSVMMVKRRALGGSAPGQISSLAAMRGYLRFDFTDVLLISIDWDEDDVIKEKVKFVCRGIKITYYAEQAGGKLDKTLPAKVWSVRAPG